MSQLPTTALDFQSVYFNRARAEVHSLTQLHAKRLKVLSWSHVIQLHFPTH